MKRHQYNDPVPLPSAPPIPGRMLSCVPSWWRVGERQAFAPKLRIQGKLVECEDFLAQEFHFMEGEPGK